MKASEVIAILNGIIAEHGDLDLFIPSNEGGHVEVDNIEHNSSRPTGGSKGWDLIFFNE